MSEINRAWLAGIFDGEGYVGIYNEGKKNKSKGEAVVVRRHFIYETDAPHKCIVEIYKL